MKRCARTLDIRARADRADRSVKTIKGVDKRARRRRDNSARSFADINAREPRTRRRKRDDAIGTKCRDEDRAAIGQPRDAARITDRLPTLECGNARCRVSEMGIEIHNRRRAHATCRNKRALHLGEFSVELRFETNLVARFDAHREDRSVVSNADASDARHQAGHIRRRECARIDHGDVVVHHAPRHQRSPVAIVVIQPLIGRVLAHDVRDARRIRLTNSARRIKQRARVGRRIHARVGTRGAVHDCPRNHRGFVARLEHREIHLGAIRTHRQRARRCTKNRGAGEHGDGQRRIEAHEFARSCERNKRARRLRGEDDVCRFIADIDRAHHAHRWKIHHAHRVGNLIHHPNFAATARAHRDGINSDRDGAATNWQSAHKIKDFELSIGGIHRKQRRAIRGDVDGM